MTWPQRAIYGAFAVIASVTCVTTPQSFAMTQQSVLMSGHDDDIIIRGCVRQADLRAYASADMLVWGRGNVMITAVPGPTDATGSTMPRAVGTTGFTNRIFYWMKHDDDLVEYLGLMVQIKGDLKDFDHGEIEVHHDDGYTKIELDLDDWNETIRVPASWLIETGLDLEHDIDIVTRRIDVDDVVVLGVCN